MEFQLEFQEKFWDLIIEVFSRFQVTYVFLASFLNSQSWRSWLCNTELNDRIIFRDGNYLYTILFIDNHIS